MVSKITQFKTGALDLPEFFTSPEYKIFTQFKSFAVNQAKFIKDNVINETLKGNFAPLTRFAVFGQLVGEGVGDIKAFIRGKKRTKGFNRLLENYATIGGFGLFSDLVSAANYGENGLYQAFAGPAVSDLVRALNSVNQCIKGNIHPLEKMAIEQLPLMGAVIFGTLGGIVGSGIQNVVKNRIFQKPESTTSPKRPKLR
jgi:hypothetical protein